MYEKSPYLIVGLGNPGRAYERTRHNIGFRVADELAERLGIKFRRKWGVPYYFCKCELNGREIIIIKPRTYMNNSGMAAYSAVHRFNVNIREMVIVADDVWLPLGMIRIREKGGPGGHNGLASVIETFGNEEISRCRIGIGGAETSNLVEYVLGKFPEEDEKILTKIIPNAVSALIEIIEKDISSAMLKYNTTSRNDVKDVKDTENFT